MTTGGGNVTLGGVVNGTGGLTLAGTGILTLAGANLYTGSTTTATGAVLNLANANAAQYSTVNVNANNTLTFASGIGTFNLGELASSAGVGNFSLTDAAASAVTLSVGLNNASTTYNGVMTSGNAGGLIKVGTGTLTLAGANAPFTGTMTINNGGVAVTGASLGATALQLGGGTLTANNAATSLSFSIGTTLNNGASSITDTAGSISLGALTRNVGGTVNLNLTVSNVTSSTGTASTILTDSGAAYATIGQDWAAKNAANSNIVGLSTIAGGYTNSTATSLSGNADVAAGVDTTLSSDASISSLRFNQVQARTITLSGGATLTTGGILNTSTVAANASTITGGTLKGAAGKDLVVIQNDTNGAGAMTIGSVIADNGSATGLTKAGGGTLILTGANSYTGATRVNAGALQFSTLGNLGNGGPIILTSGTLQYATGNTLDLSTSGRTVTFSPGNGQLGGFIDTNGNNVTFANAIGAGSTGSLIKNGKGTLTLNAANAVGTVTNPFIGLQATDSNSSLQNHGLLKLGNANTIQNGTLTVSTNDTLGFSSGIGTFNIGALAGGSQFSLTDSAAAPVTLSVGGNNLSTSFSGALRGTGSLVKVGTGILTLSTGGNFFTGDIIVNSGTLRSASGGGVQNSAFAPPPRQDAPLPSIVAPRYFGT